MKYIGYFKSKKHRRKIKIKLYLRLNIIEWFKMF